MSKIKASKEKNIDIKQKNKCDGSWLKLGGWIQSAFICSNVVFTIWFIKHTYIYIVRVQRTYSVSLLKFCSQTPKLWANIHKSCMQNISHHISNKRKTGRDQTSSHVKCNQVGKKTCLPWHQMSWSSTMMVQLYWDLYISEVNHQQGSSYLVLK